MTLEQIKSHCDIEQASEYVDTPCWLWRRSKNPKGYGNVWVGKNCKSVHRYAKSLVVGPIARQDDVHHVCRIKHCANPEHTEIKNHVTHQQTEHDDKHDKKRQQTHCKRGHEFTPENTRIYTRGKYSMRQCRACFRDHHNRRFRLVHPERVKQRKKEYYAKMAQDPAWRAKNAERERLKRARKKAGQ